LSAPDKYALFVWPAYGVTAAAFLWMLVDTLWRARRWRKAAERDKTSRDAETSRDEGAGS
jgi:heme exporter protein D